MGPTSTEVIRYGEGLFAFCNEDGVWGYADATGETVIEPRFGYAGQFSEGLASVVQGEDRCVINRAGEVVIRGRAPETGYHGGVALVWNAEEGRYRVMDRSGKYIAGPYTYASRFSEGMSGVSINVGGEVSSGYINTAGEVVIPLNASWHMAGPFHQGRALVYHQDDKQGYIGPSGAYVVEPRYEWAFRFSEGRAFVRDQDNAGNVTWSGYIDREGRQVFGAEKGAYFQNGLCPVLLAGEDGVVYVDKEGEAVIRAPEGCELHVYWPDED
mgnify:FL=1